MSDQEIDEIRRIRHDISESCGHDLARLVAYYKEVQRELADSEGFRLEGAEQRPEPLERGHQQNAAV